MNEILRCLFLFPLCHPFCTSSSSSSSLPLWFTLSSSANLPLVKLFPRSPSPSHYPRASHFLATTLLGLIHTDQGCKCDMAQRCAVPSHRWDSGLPLQKGGRSEKLYLLFMWRVCLFLFYVDQPCPFTDYTAMGSESELQSKCRVSTDGRSELHVRRNSLVCDSAGDGWTTM